MGVYYRTFYFCFSSISPFQLENFSFVDFDQKHNGGLLPHFWKASLSTFCANFLPVFPLKVSRRKKRNTFDRFFVENKWKYEKNSELADMVP